MLVVPIQMITLIVFLLLDHHRPLIKKPWNFSGNADVQNALCWHKPLLYENWEEFNKITNTWRYVDIHVIEGNVIIDTQQTNKS